MVRIERGVIVSACFVAFSLFACGNDPPPKSPTQEMVPANSASDPHPAPTDSASSTSSSSDNEVAGPLLRDSAPTPNASATASASTSTRSAGNAGPQKAALPNAGSTSGAGAGALKSGPKATSAECMHSLEKFISLDPRFAGLPPDAIKQAFTQTAGNPCDGDGITKAQYRCGMKATSSDEWQRCMQ